MKMGAFRKKPMTILEKILKKIAAKIQNLSNVDVNTSLF